MKRRSEGLTSGDSSPSALPGSEERYRALSDAAFEAVFITEEGICIDANQRAAEMFGYAHHELMGLSGEDLVAPGAKALVKRHLLSEYEKPYEALAQRKDGSTFHVEIRGRMTEYQGRRVRVTVVHDIDAYQRASVALQESEERFRTLVEHAPVAFSIMAPDRTFEYFNPKFTEIFGYTIEDIPSKAAWFERAYPDEALREAVRSIWEMDSWGRHLSPGELTRTFRVRCKDGRDKMTRFRCVVLTGGKQILAYEDITSHVAAEEELRESEKKLRYLSARLLTAHETERRRISFELHDVLGQDLAVLKLKLKLVEGELPEDREDLRRSLESACGDLDRVMGNVRELSHLLSPVILKDFGLSGALGMLLRDFVEQTGIRVTQAIDPVDRTLPHLKEITLYRIVQEALANIRKHAEATHVRVALTRSDADIFLSIEDNGRGFDPKEVESRKWPAKGLGLIAMEERGRILGGTFERVSAPGKGTRITLSCRMETASLSPSEDASLDNDKASCDVDATDGDALR